MRRLGVALGLLRCLLGGARSEALVLVLVQAAELAGTNGIPPALALASSTQPPQSPQNSTSQPEALDSSESQQQPAAIEMSAFEAAQLGYFRHPNSVSVILSVAYTLVFVVGIVGNSFVITIVCKSPRMRTVTNYFIANLALADILVLLFCLPATLMSNLFIPYVLGLFVCKTVSYLQGVAVSASINTMLAVTMDRFLAICFPMDWHMSRRLARWTIACIWLFSLSVSLPWALYFTLVSYPLESSKTIQVCAEEWPSERMGTLYFVVANLILLYLFPLCVIILCYLGIWYKIERRNIPGDQPQGLKIELIMQKSKLKVIKMMMVVVIIFLLSWFPLYLISARLKLGDELSQREDWLINKMMPLAQWLGASNSCINPILYTFFNRKYKQGFIDLLRYGFCCGPARSSSSAARQAGLCGSAEQMAPEKHDNHSDNNNNNNNNTTTSKHFNGSASSSGRAGQSSRPSSGKLATSNGQLRGSGSGNQQLLAIKMDILMHESSSSCLTQVRDAHDKGERQKSQVPDKARRINSLSEEAEEADKDKDKDEGEDEDEDEGEDEDEHEHGDEGEDKNEDEDEDRDASGPLSRALLELAGSSNTGGSRRGSESLTRSGQLRASDTSMASEFRVLGRLHPLAAGARSTPGLNNNNNLSCPGEKVSATAALLNTTHMIGFQSGGRACSSLGGSRFQLARTNNKCKRLESPFESRPPFSGDANKLNPLPSKSDDELAGVTSFSSSYPAAAAAELLELKPERSRWSPLKAPPSVCVSPLELKLSQVARNLSGPFELATRADSKIALLPGEEPKREKSGKSLGPKSNLNLKWTQVEQAGTGYTLSGRPARSLKSCSNSLLQLREAGIISKSPLSACLEVVATGRGCAQPALASPREVRSPSDEERNLLMRNSDSDKGCVSQSPLSGRGGGRMVSRQARLASGISNKGLRDAHSDKLSLLLVVEADYDGHYFSTLPILGVEGSNSLLLTS